MVVSSKQFRKRYPNAAVTTELLAIQDGHFVVKALIQTEAATATAMAADMGLETAEDRAVQRAIARIAAWELETVPAASLVSLPPPALVQPVELTPLPPVVGLEATVNHSQAPTSRAAPEDSKPLETAAILPKADQKVAPPLPETAPPGLESLGTMPFTDIATESSLPPTLPSPVNLSDVIAQTDVELQRLSWSVADGRDYLEKAYGKRSRHDLTDEELLAFLLHLESLPTPNPSLS